MYMDLMDDVVKTIFEGNHASTVEHGSGKSGAKTVIEPLSAV